MFEVMYLFVDGLAERLHLGQPREAVLTLRLQLRLRLLTGCAIVSPRERKGLGRSSACRVRNRTARKGRRQPRPNADEVRTGDQPQDRQGTRP
jgi:hypothetical protein